MTTLTLYSKPGCHLCEELRAKLEAMQAELAFRIEEIDITQTPELFDRYRYDIPVLLLDGVEFGRGRIDPEIVKRSLHEGRPKGRPLRERM